MYQLTTVLKITTTLLLLTILNLKVQGQYIISNDCGTNLQTEVFIKGIKNASSPFIDIGNISTTTQLIVNVWIDEKDCSTSIFPSTITITNGSQTFTPSGISVTQNTGYAEQIYRVTINNPTSSIVNISNLGTCTSSSVSVQKVSTSTNSASYARVIDKEFHSNNSTYTMNIGSATQARTVRISVPVHEKDNTGLIARVEVWGTGVTLISKEITMQTNGDEAGLIEIDVPNVPISVTQLSVNIISPTTSGASFGVGVLTASTITPCSTCSTLTADAGSNQTICPSTSTTITVSASGGTAPYTYAWNGVSYSSPNTNPSRIVSPSTNTTYSVTVTDANGCTTSDNITINVAASSSCSEVCGNGIDDDDDGLTDCEDSDCYLAANSGDSDYDNDGIGDYCDLDDDNDGITDEDEGCPSCIGGIFTNGDFEENMTHSSAIQTNQANVPGWSTTSTDGKIEIWRSGYSNTSPVINSQNGNYHAEINATQNAALYQRVCSKPGTQFSWSVWHRGRAGTDEAVVRIGSTLPGTPIQTTMLTGNNAWVQYTGTYTVPPNQVETYFIFEAVSTASDITVGNFVDNIVITELSPGTCLDTDGDGTENYRDSDSDNDGCPDAIEGEGNVTVANIDGNLRIIGTVSNQGIPVFVNLGQGYGDSQNALILGCPEVCNDGIDNDGDGLTDCADSDCKLPSVSTIITD